MKTFNTAVICNPDKHYMVDITERVDRIVANYIENGKYFSINRGRQYGKTTTLYALSRRLQEQYYCLSLSFEWADELFESKYRMASGFVRMVKRELRLRGISEELIARWSRKIDEAEPFADLDERITELCAYSDREIILMIDEVDKASNNQVMLQLLGLLRDKYIRRDSESDYTFKSVILAGVYDIKNLKLKIQPENEHRYNSPWNVAVVFEEDLTFDSKGIAGMLREYEDDYQTGMDVEDISNLIYDYTSGYPVLVSGICKLLDEKISGSPEFPTKTAAWTRRGVAEAAKLLQRTPSSLFENMIKQIEDFPELKEMLKRILFEGDVIAWNSYNKVLSLAKMFDYIKNDNNHVAVSNRVFEVVLYDYFLSEEELDSIMNKEAQLDKSQFIKGKNLDMDALLSKFAEHYQYVYADNDQKFVEKYARKIFLMYLKPIINGAGNYYVEAETRDARRTDIVVDYHGLQYVVETKIWYGPIYNADGEEQLCDYLDKLGLKKGYMLTFSFNKNKKIGMQEISMGDKTLVEVTV